MKKVTDLFNNGSPKYTYSIALPMVGMLQKTFSPETIDRYLIQATAPWPIPVSTATASLRELLAPVYDAFMDDVAGKISNFFEKQGEVTAVVSMLDDSPFAFGVLRFTATDQSAAALKENAELIFADIIFSNEYTAKGFSWKNVSITRENALPQIPIIHIPPSQKPF